MILLVLWEWFCSFWLQLISKTSNVRWKADTFNSAMFQDVSISLPREVTPQGTRRNWSSKSGLKHLRDVYLTFIHHLLSLLGLVSPTSWTDRSFELILSLFVFYTQAFHKISIQTSINNTEKVPQVTRSNNSAISIDNDASDLWLLFNFVLFLLKKTKVTFLPILVKWQISVKWDVHNTSLSIKYEIAQIFYDWFDNLKDCLLYTSDAADEEDSVDLGGRRIIKKKKM